MDHGHIVINSRLLQNLNTYIDEDDVAGSIARLSTEIDKIESSGGKSARSCDLRRDNASLENQLAYSREQADLRT